MAQRLVRTICKECKTPFTPAENELPADFPHPDGKIPTLYKGAGCRTCRQTGYKGRTGIHELMVTTDAIREMVTQHVNAAVIRRKAQELGMLTLRQDGFRKALLGTTTWDEVARVTAGDIL